MARLSKRVRAFKEKVEPGKAYPFEEAVSLMQEFATVKFNETVEVAVNLEEWDTSKDWNRDGLKDSVTTILGVKVPRVAVPLFPGKNITVISQHLTMI